MALKKCLECGKEISDEAGKCPNCGKTQTKRSTRSCLVLIILLFIIFIAIPAIFNDLTGRKSTTSSSSVSVGKNGYLDSGGELVPVASDEAAFDAWNSAIVAKDEHGKVLLLASLRVFAVPKGTKVLVIDMATFKRKVRILDGKKKGWSGWVAMEYVKEG